MVLVYLLVIKGKKNNTQVAKETSVLIEVPLEKRPIVSLTPSIDGHWLKLKIEKILSEASSLDYELLYQLPDGRTQGVPGTVDIRGQSMIERDLLMGSESSGRFRYDEGVKEGSVTVRFRNDKGKLMAKFSGKFHLQSADKELTSIDGKFTYTLDKKPSKTFFVTMETFGLPEGTSVSEVTEGPYGIFTSAKSFPSGAAPEWQKLDSNIFYK